MAQIQSDESGFLVGQRVDFARAAKTLIDIRNEIHQLNTRLGSGPARNMAAPPRAQVQPQTRAPRRRNVINPEYLPPLETSTPVTPRRATNPNQQRDASGRFVARDRSARSAAAERPSRPEQPSAAEVEEDKKHRKLKSDADSAVVKLARSAVGAVGSTPDIDPSIAAAKEVGAAIAPLGRGFGKLFGSDKSKDNKVWYRRIWNELRGERRESADFHRAELRRLSSIEESGRASRSGSGSGGGILGAVGGLLGRIPGVGALGKILGGAGGGLLRAGGSLLKRLPLIGGLFAGASAAASIFGPDDPDKSPEENRRDRFTGGAGGIGAILGGAIGSFLGPIGTVAGGIIGNKVGELVGAWLATFDWQKIGDQITATWNTAVTKVGDIAKSVSEAWSGITTAVKSFVKDKFGVDVDSMSAKVAKAGAKVVDAVSPYVSPAVDYAKGTVSRLAAPVGRVLSAAKSYVTGGAGLGGLIGKHEGGYNSFNRGIAGDSKGQEMMFENMTVSDIMKEQAKPKGDPSRLFAVGKYQVIPETLKGAVSALGLKGDEKFTPELQERIFSEYLADKKRPDISGFVTGKHDDLNKATLAASKEWASIADPSTGRSYYDKTGGNKASISSDKIGGELTSARSRYQALIAQGVDEKQALSMALSGSQAGANLAVMTASTTPSVPAAPKISDAPVSSGANVAPVSKAGDVPSIPNTAASKPIPIEVNVNSASSGDVGQDVSDRKIAHIATGGIGGSLYG